MDQKDVKVQRPILDPNERTNVLINLSEDLAEQRLRDGTASSQLITHFLKLATKREEAEVARINQQTEYMKCKSESLKADDKNKEEYDKALKAFSIYRGDGNENEDVSEFNPDVNI